MATFPGNNSAFRGVEIDSRAQFITRTYTHVVCGILAFILIGLALFESGAAEQIARFMLGFNWFLILGAFMLHGIQPGPQILATSAGLVYTVFASLFLGLVLMCVIGTLGFIAS